MCRKLLASVGCLVGAHELVLGSVSDARLPFRPWSGFGEWRGWWMKPGCQARAEARGERCMGTLPSGGGACGAAVGPGLCGCWRVSSPCVTAPCRMWPVRRLFFGRRAVAAASRVRAWVRAGASGMSSAGCRRVSSPGVAFGSCQGGIGARALVRIAPVSALTRECARSGLVPGALRGCASHSARSGSRGAAGSSGVIPRGRPRHRDDAKRATRLAL